MFNTVLEVNLLPFSQELMSLCPRITGEESILVLMALGTWAAPWPLC